MLNIRIHSLNRFGPTASFQPKGVPAAPGHAVLITKWALRVTDNKTNGSLSEVSLRTTWKLRPTDSGNFSSEFSRRRTGRDLSQETD